MAGQRYTLIFDANLDVTQIKGALNQIQTNLNTLHLPQNIAKGLQGSFDNLKKEVQSFEAIMNKDITGKTDFNKLENQANKVATAYEKLKIQVKNLTSLSSRDIERLFPETVSKNIDQATTALKNYQANMAKAKRDVADAAAQVAKFQQKIQEVSNKTPLTNDEWKQLKTDIANAEQEVAKYKAAIQDAQQRAAAVEARTPNYKKSSTWREAQQDIQKYTSALQGAEQEVQRLNGIQQNSITYTKQNQQLTELNTKLADAKNNYAQLEQALKLLESTGNGGGLKALLDEIGRITGLDMSKFKSDLTGVGDALQAYFTQAANNAATSVNNLGNATKGAEQPIANLGAKVRDTGAQISTMDSQIRDVQALKTRIQYFFGLNNAINLVKRAIRGAINTIKELDKAMTETAVVTNFSVSDMWAQLPEYTKRANELGVTTLAAYQAATLYYQQGLKTNEVNALSVETLKMARIAGLDAAEATDRMTNALRGFNMELTTANAQRVDDVYSELAANTASNVDEISTAMTKVASLAHNANMEFETTAAFLAQIIETTRESAETAGTALKTVIARFSEVKKLVDEGTLRGQDEEGQVIDVNKVSAALRTAGIDMNKYFLGEVGLDDIFMELASKWDSLTALQQRYIATQAAGSRQQSRFIALMSDYARTQELVGKAYKANGAAARQFEKTQDSLESKLARLKNAWNEFLMGLSNNVVVKGAVDFLTDLLNLINKLTGALGDGVGTLAKWGVVAAGIFGGRALLATGGLVDRALVGLLGGTGIGNALTGAGIIGGTKAGRGNLFKQIAASRANRAAAFSQIGTGSVAAWNGIGAIGQFGTKIGNSSKVARALSKTKFASGLGALLGFGTGGTGAAAGATAASTAAAGLATALGAVALAATACVVAYKLWEKYTPQGQLKVATKVADAMSSVAENAQKAASKIRDVAENAKKYQSAIDDATSVSDRKKAIQDQNEYILSLLKEDATYAQYIQSTFTEGGQLYLTLDSDALAAAVDKIAEGAVRASAYSGFANAVQQKKKVDVYKTNLNGVDLANRTIQAGYDENSNVIYRPLTDKEFFKYSNYQAQIDAANIAMRNYATTAASQLISLENTNLNSELNNLVASVIGKAFNADEVFEEAINTKKDNWWGGKATDAQIRAEYSRLYGSDLEKKYDKSDTQYAIALGQVLEEEFSTQIPDLLDIADDVSGKMLLEVISGSYKGNITDDQLKKAFDTLNDKQKKSIEQLLGVGPDAVYDALNKQAAEIKAIQENQKKAWQHVNTQTAEQVIQLGSDLGWSDKRIASSIADILSLDSFDEQLAISDLLSSIDDSKIAEAVLKNLNNSDLREWITNLDFSNPINGLLQLQDAANSGERKIRKLGKSLQDASTFSTSSLLTYFTQSSDYESLKESLADFIDENGKISSSNIIELAKSNKTLNNLLKTGAISAKALAQALTGIETGKIQVWDLNDAIIKALNSMDDLDGMVKHTIDDLNSFDPGYDENDVTDFINKVVENATKNIEKGAWGNNQMRNYMEYIFGSYEGAPGDEYTAWLQNGLNWLNANKENMQSAWADIAYASEEAAIASGKAIPIWQENGEIVIDIGQHTTDELVTLLQEQTGLTEQQIRMMIADYKNYSDDFALTLERNDIKDAVSVWAQEAGAQGWYLDKDLQTLAAALGVDVGEINKVLSELNPDLKEIKFGEGSVDDIKRILSDANLDNYITNRRDAFHYSDEYMQSQIERGLTQESYFTKDLINFDQLKQSMSDANLAGQFESTINQMTQVGESFIADFNGQLKTVTIKTGETATEAYARVAEESARNALAGEIGDAVANALGEAEVNVNTDNAKKAIETLFGDLKTAYATADTYSTSINISTDIAAQNIRDLASAYSELAKSIEAASTAGSGGAGSTDGVSGARGGYVSSYGSGSYRVEPGIALTGEEDPEIIWNKEKGYAYITGKNGPEFQNLQPGDRVFNAQETKKILRNSSVAKGGVVSSRPVHGYGDVKISGESTGSGSDSDSDKYQKQSTWRNELDWLYDLMEDIAEYERQQNIIQTRNELALEDIASSGRDLYKLTREELTNLETQLDGQQAAQLKRLQQMGELQTQVNAAGYSRYMQWNQQDQTLEIDWDAIEAIQDKETYDEVTDWLSRMESVQDQIDDAEDAMWDIKKQIQELQERYLQKYLDFQNRVLEAIVKQYQDQIDKLSEINDNVNDTNASILDSIQREIDLERQIRDNTDAESDIADMEARLAYLQRDTTGANATEIRQLQEQLDEARKNYGDTLIDQAVDRLAQSNEDAATQREKQIELMQAQLDYWQESGGLWSEVEQLMSTGFNGNGSLIRGSDLEKVLQNAENYEAMSQAQRDNWANELILETNQVGAYILELANGMNVNAEQIRALLTNLIEQLGGTPEHSYTAEKAEEKYATGGLNTYTGLAHLDGTPSAPEYVLNPEQTNAFLRLADVLPSIMSGDSIGGTTYGGDIYLNLSMHVDEIASDYDVDRIADRVKDILYDASSYRNVNTLNFIR